MPNLVDLCQTTNVRDRQKKMTSRILSLKVIRTDTDRSATCNLILY